jgi:hypothetical protein
VAHVEADLVERGCSKQRQLGEGAPEVGGTAFTVDDTLSIVDDELFSGEPQPPVSRVVEEVCTGFPNSLVRRALNMVSLRGTLGWRPHSFADYGSRSAVSLAALATEMSPLLSECQVGVFQGATA